ncbi:MAG: DNA alkylation repair protein [Myxococcales bacterium]|nr:DNA alkylation repair protein [Myxococcales bacterium]
MAEPLKNFFDRALVERIAASIVTVMPAFDRRAFVRDAAAGLDELELLARSNRIAEALAKHLPQPFDEAAAVITASLGAKHAKDELVGAGMGPFFYLPHTMFVAARGLDHFERAMDLQYEITQRFTCEFSIRPFIDRHPDATLARLARWARDPSPHVRRLVSEGTRQRLPWASRVRLLDEHPERALELVELLRDDPSAMVRRSVANHLNDLTKSRPELVYAVCERWLTDADAQRRALVAYALRSAIKKGDRRALALVGRGDAPKVSVESVAFEPARVRIGESLRVRVELKSSAPKASEPQSLEVDLVVHFVKQRGTSAKVFKLSRVSLAPRGEVTLEKSISLAVHTTRTPNVGRHVVELQVNGVKRPLGHFDVAPARVAKKRA